MNRPRSFLPLILTLLLPAAAALVGSAYAQAPNPPGDSGSPAYQAREGLAYSLGMRAYIYGFPLFESERTMALATGVDRPEGMQAPLGQFAHVRALITPEFKDVVTPNNDTLYSSAWVDLAREPVILSVPEPGGRYYAFQLMDAWTDVFDVVGRRTRGAKAGNYAIVGPGWQGSLPPDVERIKATTDLIWILGRTLVEGPEDLKQVHALQDRYRLTPLSTYLTGKPAPAPPKAAFIPLEARDDLRFFAYLDKFLARTPPRPEDADLMAQLQKIGLTGKGAFDPEKLDQATKAGLERGLQAARLAIAEAWQKGSDTKINGWSVMTGGLGDYGTDYLLRAAVAYKAYGALPAREAVYPMAEVDDQGRPLTGDRHYVLHFAPGRTPPVEAFWSITMYGQDTKLLVSNPIQRYSIGDRTRGLKFHPDGSLDIYLWHGSPGKDREPNWLPSPAGGFYLVLRMYNPKKEVLDGTYRIPPVKRVN